MPIYGWELLAVCHHPDKFGDQRHFDSGDIMNLICQLTSLDHMFKALHELMGGMPSRYAGNLSCLVAIFLVQVKI